MNVNKKEKERRTQAERRAATRLALLDAARSAFAERGYHGAAAEEIVRRAGLTRGALYHHFEDKKDLFRAVVDEMEGEIDKKIEEAERAQSGLPEAVMAGYRVFLDAALDPEMRRTFFLDGPSVLGWEWHEIDARHAVGKIEEGLESLIGEGLMEPPTGQAAGPPDQRCATRGGEGRGLGWHGAPFGRSHISSLFGLRVERDTP